MWCEPRAVVAILTFKPAVWTLVRLRQEVRNGDVRNGRTERIDLPGYPGPSHAGLDAVASGWLVSAVFMLGMLLT
jgi:hypothetical protein